MILQPQFLYQRPTPFMFQARKFSTVADLIENRMEVEEAEKLHELMDNFESNPSKSENAYVLFRELNKHGMYLTVVRLYNKHESDYNLRTDKSTELLKSQYEYARDNIQQMKYGSIDSY